MNSTTVLSIVGIYLGVKATFAMVDFFDVAPAAYAPYMAWVASLGIFSQTLPDDPPSLLG